MALTSEDRELAFTSAYELIQMIKSKKLSPVELMGAIIRRIGALNPKLNAYLTVVEEEAMQAARQAEAALGRGIDLGLLHGLPMSIKDLYCTKGIRTTSGSLVYKDFVPDEEYTMVKRLKAAGAIIVGKTNTPEFGLAASTENRLGDACRNPWNTERTSGGSSGGAAASAAAGISPLALGSDGAGSIRIPGSFCGVYGLKPTNGRVPYELDRVSGAILDNACLGPLTRNVKDAALMMNVMSGPDGIDYMCIRAAPPDFLKELNGSLKKLRIAWSSDLGYDVTVDPKVKSITESAVHAFEELGHEVEEATPSTEAPFDAWTAVEGSQVNVARGSLLDQEADKLMPYTREFLGFARKLSGADVAKGWFKVEKWRGAMLEFFERYDLLVTPTVAVSALPIGEETKKLTIGELINWGLVPFTPIFNLTRNPAATVPCGFSSDGLPIGLQIVGRLEDDVTVLQASAAFEKVRPWADKRPLVS